METGLLLINLGSPKSTSVQDVRGYLNEFLMDKNVIDLPWPVRRTLVSLILINRPKESAKAYQEIWWEEGSPLIVNSRRLEEKVRPLWKHGPVELGMRYAEPSIETAVLNLINKGVKKIVVAPLYPQYAQSTTFTAVERVENVIKKHKLKVEIKDLQAFYDHPIYLDALWQTTEPYLQQDFDHLLFSFHGLPESHLKKIDPSKKHCLKCENCCQTAKGDVLATCYRAQCYKSAEAIAKKAGLAPECWSVAFQSRLGKNKWIEPYTDAHLDQLAEQGVKKMLIMSPAFVADCIETLEELGLRAKEDFVAAGGENLELIPCLNDDEHWAEALVKLCEEVK